MIDNYITGSHGFIGSHLMRRLEGQINVPLPYGTKSFQYFKRFFFLSSYGNLSHQTEDDKIREANVHDLLKIISRIESGTFVFTSTSSVLLPVQTAYSRCKRAAEEILLSIQNPNIRVIIVRPYSVTGVGEQPQHLIPRLIHSCATGDPIPFCPEPTHDWIDVEDIVTGLVGLSENPNARGIYELGNHKPIPNWYVKQVVETEMGSPANTVEMPPRAYDNKEWFCMDYAADMLLPEPRKSLETSIRQMVVDYHERACEKVH